MEYNFNEIIDRSGFPNAKYDERIKKFGREDVIPLWIADMDFRTAKPVVDACVKRAEHGLYGYVSKPDSYKQAAIDFEKRRHNWNINIEDISFAVGIVPAMSELVREFTEPGDSVLIQTPVYPEFYEIVEAWEGRSVIENILVNNDGYYTIDFDDLEEKMKMKPKLFILCNPANPVGRVWKRDELERVCNLALKYNIPMIADEIHGDFQLFGNKYIPVATLSEEIKKNTICCFSASKTFNLAGLQACNVIFHNHEWKKRFDKFWASLDIHRNNCFSLCAMETAWNEGDEWLEQMLVYLEGNYLFVSEFLEENLPMIKMRVPEATYLAWIDFRALEMNSKELNEFMINEARVGMNNGSDFCRSLEGFMRMNLAHPRSVIEKALKQIEVAIKNIKLN